MTSIFDKSLASATTTAVPGTSLVDSNNPIRKRFNYIEEIYDPDRHPVSEKDRYIVPKEGELVADVSNGRLYFVNRVDIQAGYKTYLTPWSLQSESEGTTEQDWIFGERNGMQNGEALLAIDYSVRPNIARVDSTIVRPGAAYALLYLGNETGINGTIISAQYDKSTNKIDNKIPCVLAEIIDRTNVNIMTTGQFSVTLNEETLTNGTRCTLAFYDEGGNYIPPSQPVMVQHSAYMKDHQIGMRTITGIELLSPWFTNTTDPERLMVPLGTPVVGLEWRAKVHYSDGVSVESSVNGGQFSLIGLNRYRPTYPGQEAELVLSYAMAPDETPELANPGAPWHISKRYVVEAGPSEGIYMPRLFTIPEWDNSTGRYALAHYLYDMDREVRINVTDKVTYNDQSPPFKPGSYGIQQNLIFNLNLRDVDIKYQSVIIRQFTNITLYKDVNGPGKRWDVQYTEGKPAYVGAEFNVKNNGAQTTFNLTAGFATQDDWLKGLYWSVDPAYNRLVEEKAPTPNCFDLMDGKGGRYRYQVADWNKDNAIAIELVKGHTYFIAWINQDQTGAELQLAMTGVIAKPV